MINSKNFEKIKKRIISTVIIIVLLSFGLYADAASGFNDDFESYQTGKTQSETSAALKARGWSIDDGKLSENTGKIDIISCNNIMDKPSLAVSISSQYGDPYMQLPGIDFTGERVLSVDINPVSMGSNIDIMLTSVWLSVIKITPAGNGTGNLSVFEKSAGTLSAGEWYNIVIKSSYTAGQFTFTVYLNGDEKAVNETKNLTVTTSHILRIGLAGGGTTALFDNFSLKELSAFNFNSVTPAPANNAQNIAVSTTGMSISFGTIVKKSTVGSAEVVKEENGNPLNVPVSVTLNPWGNGIDINFLQNLQYNAKYTVALSDGISDIAGNTIPSGKTVFVFYTIPEPLPIAVITSPLSGEEFNIANPVPLVAAASNENGNAIIKVEFYVDNEYAGEAFNAPFTYNYTALSAGAHTVKARAYDIKGAGEFSQTVTFSAVSYLPDAVVTSPQDGEEFDIANPITLIADAAGKNGVLINKVEFYINNQYAGEVLSAPFSYDYAATAVGEYSVKARAYDANGTGAFSPPVKFAVTSRSYATVASYSFEDYDGSAAPSGSVAVANEGVFGAEKVDASHGTSLKMSLSGAVTSGPYISFNFPPVSKGVLIAECDIFMTNTAHQTLMFTIKSSAGQWSGDFSFENGNIAGGTPPSALMAFSANAWYSVREVYNMDTKKFDLYINNVLVLSNKSLNNPALDDIPGLRITYNSPVGAFGALYVDNVLISRMIEPLKWGAPEFKTASNETMQNADVDRLSAIVLKGNKGVVRPDVTPSNIFIAKNGGESTVGAKIDASVSYDSVSGEISIKPSGKLIAGMSYYIIIKGNVRDADGIPAGRDVKFSFYTPAQGFGASQISFINNGNPVSTVLDLKQGGLSLQCEIKNETSGNKEAVIILAMYKNGVLKAYKINKQTVTAGQSLYLTSGGLPVSDEDIETCEFTGYVWEGARHAVSGQISLGK